MRSVKHMTKAQLTRIQLNNYCSEHDRYGKQFDYEAKGYREEIDARLWELSNKKVNNMLKQAKIDIKMDSTVKGTISAPICEKPLIEATDTLKNEIKSLDIQLSVMRAFNGWRFIGNELMMKYGVDK